ncbi:MAG: flagellar protein FlaG [Lachnospiraceae bacterium]|nr:flagellar protein FlaG [Lachnospiraceae bacterium]
MEIKSNYGISRPEQGSSVAKSNPAPAPAPETSGADSQSLSSEVNKVTSAVTSLETESEREPSQDQLKKAVSEINKNAQGTEAIFGFHDATNRVTIKIVDKDTKEVIKELPPEKTLDLIAKAWEMAGLLVDEKR